MASFNTVAFRSDIKIHYILESLYNPERGKQLEIEKNIDQ